MAHIVGSALIQRLKDGGAVRFEPWEIYSDERRAALQAGLTQRFPGRRLVVFAGRLDNDDRACFDLDDGPGCVSVIHDFAGVGWEQRARFPDAGAWLRAAIEDFIDAEPWG